MSVSEEQILETFVEQIRRPDREQSKGQDGRSNGTKQKNTRENGKGESDDSPEIACRRLH